MRPPSACSLDRADSGAPPARRPRAHPGGPILCIDLDASRCQAVIDIEALRRTEAAFDERALDLLTVEIPTATMVIVDENPDRIARLFARHLDDPPDAAFCRLLIIPRVHNTVKSALNHVIDSMESLDRMS